MNTTGSEIGQWPNSYCTRTIQLLMKNRVKKLRENTFEIQFNEVEFIYLINKKTTAAAINAHVLNTQR